MWCHYNTIPGGEYRRLSEILTRIRNTSQPKMKYTALLTVVTVTLYLTCTCVDGRIIARRGFIIDRQFEDSKCAYDDSYNTICYGCGRQFSSVELFTECCNEESQVARFCSRIYGRR
ncbi:uncharacterized protein LOC110451316 [Mizuhopecten yessoensis]|uniref:uncharacterized protein LOC110451316 n=1 Tax=Mizuhopecten yessoensis TaxID=6573 RepID=UPI000B4582A4|nr:uncharacterized protein LOC110451316 [Mizuhopecten yessoensis]